MKICPIAIAVGCQKCPAFKVCPLKSALGDAPKAVAPTAAAAKPTKTARPAKKTTAARKRQKK